MQSDKNKKTSFLLNFANPVVHGHRTAMNRTLQLLCLAATHRYTETAQEHNGATATPLIFSIDRTNYICVTDTFVIP